MSAEGLHKRETPKGRASMREKLVDKHSAADEHERNFSSGRVNVRERYLHRTGIRGRKIWIFFAILFFLTMIALVNLLLLVIMFHTLQISKNGMDSLSFFESGTLRWMRSSDLEVVTSYTGQINAFNGQNLDIQSDQEKIVIMGGKNNFSAQVHVGNEETVILAKKGFRFVDPYVKKTVIHFDGKKVKLLHDQFTSKKTVFNMTETHRVVTNEDQDLTLSTDKSAEVRGNEGVFLDGKKISFLAKDDITLSSTLAQDIVIDAAEGIKFGNLSRFLPKSVQGNVKPAYKLCACANTGKLYRVLVVEGLATCRTVEKIC